MTFALRIKHKRTGLCNGRLHGCNANIVAKQRRCIRRYGDLVNFRCYHAGQTRYRWLIRQGYAASLQFGSLKPGNDSVKSSGDFDFTIGHNAVTIYSFKILTEPLNRWCCHVADQIEIGYKRRLSTLFSSLGLVSFTCLIIDCIVRNTRSQVRADRSQNDFPRVAFCFGINHFLRTRPAFPLLASSLRHRSRKVFSSSGRKSRSLVQAPSGRARRVTHCLTLPILPSCIINLCDKRPSPALTLYNQVLVMTFTQILNANRSAIPRPFVFCPSSSSCLSEISLRRCNNKRGISIFTGHTSRQAPHKLEA